MGFLWKESWSVLPNSPTVEHILLELFTMTHPSWVALHSMACNVIELHQPLSQDKSVIHEGVQYNKNSFIYCLSYSPKQKSKKKKKKCIGYIFSSISQIRKIKVKVVLDRE